MVHVQVGSASKKEVRSYKDLLVWQKSVALAVRIYKVTAEFPKSQQYGMVSQIERSAVSISSNIAEGAGRKGKKEFIQYLSIAKGSLYELETQLIISYEVGFLDKNKLDELISEIEEIGKMLHGLRRSMQS